MPRLKHFLYLLCIGVIMGMTACGDDDDDDNNDDNDDDQMGEFSVGISVDPTSITEGEMATVEVALDMVNNTGSVIQIDLTRPPGGTAQPGADYSDVPGNVRIEDGEQSASFTISAEDDSDDEDDETVILSIDVAALPPSVGGTTNTDVTLTIVDDDGSSAVVDVCPNDNSTDQNNFTCDETPSASSSYTESVAGDVRTIMGNGIPSHDFRNQIPMIVSDLNSETQTYTVDATPALASSTTSITNEGMPIWVFGIALNGVKIDPAPAQPFIFEDTNTGEFNFDWVFEPNNNMEAVGLDCAVAHVQPDGQYHYHGDMGIYADQLSAGISTGTAPSAPVHIGWAGDGFPIVYKYGPDANGTFKELQTGWTLKTGQRPGDGVSEPCGEYNGKYTNDYEFTDAGDLDECNGIAQSITIGSENFDYFYVITSDFPIISRCLSGTVDDSFKLGPP